MSGKSFVSVSVMLAMAILLNFAVAGDPAWAAGPTAQLAAVGTPKPGAVGLQVWTNKEEGEAFREGDRVILQFQPDREAYLTVLSVNPQEVTVLFPNKESPDAQIKAGKFYTMFGDDALARLFLGKKSDDSKLVFYVSSAPIKLEEVKALGDKGWLTIASGSEKEVTGLKGQLEALAKEETFNRVVIPLKGSAGESFELKITEMPESVISGKRVPKRLPSPVESEQPETVTGVQGIKKDPKKSEK